MTSVDQREAGVVGRGPDATPVLFLPVRIETRFVDSPDRSELWVRIYPDQVQIDGHQPELSADELAAGTSYWNDLWLVGNPSSSLDAAQAPWRGLVARFGAPRAAWIARQCTPVNITDRPAAPTAPGQAPSPALQPASPPVRGLAAMSPATARLLPEHWTVGLDGAGGTSTVTGSPVAADLAVSLAAADGTLTDGFPDGLPVDEGMRWLVDFDAAVAVGMAVRVPLTAAQRSAGFDRVLVYGLGTQQGGSSIDPDVVTSLLEAHHYSDGLAFVPQGAPTNNTVDASSAYRRSDPGADNSFAVEASASLTAADGSDGPLAARLLGVPRSVFDHVQEADRFDQRDSSDMITALWPATLGYFLRQMGDGTLSEDQVEAARLWTIDHVRPRGPLPALRTGQTPYGILPVTSTARWVSADADPVEATVLTLVRRLLPTWVDSSAAAPHLGATPGDPDADLAHVLGQDASSMTFRGRHVLGDELLWNVLSLDGIPPSASTSWWQPHLAAGRGLLDSLGYTGWDPRLVHTGLAPSDYPVEAATVVAGPLSETDPLPMDATVGTTKLNYIQWLRQASIADIRANSYPGIAVPDTLLYRILRQCMLLDYVTLAQFAQLREGLLTTAQTREQELVAIATSPPAPSPVARASQATAAAAEQVQAQVTPWEVLARPVSVADQRSWAEYLVALDPPPESPFARLAHLRASFDRLSTLPTAELDRLLTETLDVCSHRLDAWVTSLATARLASQRAAVGSDGGGPGSTSPLRTGGYGWVENLRPAAPRAPLSAAVEARVADLDVRRERLYPHVPQARAATQAPPDNGGFIHAPSLAQAATAAVLRSGYLSHQGGAEDGLLSLDLSSDRVRAALWLLDGVRQGQPLGALLGYRLETAMHDAGLDAYIQPLRDRFPIVGGKLTPTSPGAEFVAASNVVDGIALDRARSDGTLDATADWGAGLPGVGSDRTTLLGLFAALDDTVDAISDVGVAEAVYQTMRGNPDRTAGTLDAVSQAQHMPQPQVVSTPRGGTDQTHRVMTLFAGAPAAPLAWAAVPATPRSRAEAWLSAWVAGLLPDPTTIAAQVSYTPAGGAPVITTVRLSELEIGPLDVLALCRIDSDPQRSELEARILYHALPSDAGGIVISYSSPPGTTSFADLVNTARAIDDLIAGARPLAARDLVLPESTVPAAIDISDLNARASSARAGLDVVVADLAVAAAGGGGPDGARDAILAAAGYGVPGAIPPSPRGSGPDAALVAQATSLHRTLASRAAALAAITPSSSDPAPALEVLGTVFGPGFVVLPRFAPPDAAVLRAEFGLDPSALGADPTALARWQQQLTHVRPGIARLDLALLLGEVVAGATPPVVRVAQLPAVTGDRWLALPVAPGPTARAINGRLALVAHVVGDVSDPSVSWSGLLVDAWPERVPSTTESAGVAFHHDEPKARAPQALLLAVCPDLGRGWDEPTLQAVLGEAFDLARARTVDLGSVGRVGQVLPALYFPFNLRQDTVSMVLSQHLRLNEIVLDVTRGKG
ncbi:MAG: hypothetical protein ACOH17_07245 [Cellulomonas sp.]